MTLSVRPMDPVSRPFFSAEASGLDITKPLTPDQAASVEKAMDQYAVLVFHNQQFTDETQLAFSRNFGPLEEASGDIDWGKPRRLESRLINDISNLDVDNQVMARDNRKRLFTLGNRLWHSDSSFKEVPAKYSLLSARLIPSAGGNTEFADMRAAYDTLDTETKAEIADLVCEHSQLYSRAQLGFSDFTEEDQIRLKPGVATSGSRPPLHRPQVALPRLPRRHHRRLARPGSPSPVCAT